MNTQVKDQPVKVLILGGGFGGIYTALHLERLLARRRDLAHVEVTLINQDNFFLFTPMLHEVAASDLDITHIVNPVRKLLRRVQFFQGNVEAVNLEERQVVVSHGLDSHTHVLGYDHLVLGLGSTTNFYGLPGVEEQALTMRSLSDAITLRNRVIQSLEEADTECATGDRQPLLTFVVAGGGFAGVETVAAIHDFAVEAMRFYPNLSSNMLRMVLVHSGEVILPELGEELGRYAQNKLTGRGVEVRLGVRVAGYEHGAVRLSDGSALPAYTLVWTAGTAPNPLLATLPCMRERGRVAAKTTLEVSNWPGVWALGDCACVPDSKTGQPFPPTAQHALRQGKVVAENILATIEGKNLHAFDYQSVGQLASLGRRTGVARVFGFNFSGFLAWWMWRTIYLSKLPRFEKKLRVALDWTLDLLFTKDLVQFMTYRLPDHMPEALVEPAWKTMPESTTPV